MTRHSYRGLVVEAMFNAYGTGRACGPLHPCGLVAFLLHAPSRVEEVPLRWIGRVIMANGHIEPTPVIRCHVLGGAMEGLVVGSIEGCPVVAMTNAIRWALGRTGPGRIGLAVRCEDGGA